MHRYQSLMRLSETSKDEGEMQIKIFSYNRERYEERDVKRIDVLSKYIGSEDVVWIDIQGGYSTGDIEKLGNIFEIHPSAIRSALTVSHRPTYEEFEGHIFIIVDQIYMKNTEIMKEQISIFLRENILITLQEKPGDIFESIRKKIRNNTGKIRWKGADFLIYSLIKKIFDNYFEVLESLGMKIDNIEERLLKYPDRRIMRDLHEIRREILFLKHMVWPMRGVIDGIYRDETENISKDTKRYIRGLQDISIQMIEIAETYRDMVSSMTDIYLSSLSYRTNEIMKILTIIATIFIPLTFITGLYGMNFRYMPEIYWYWGYPAVLLGMLFVATIMLLYFRKKKWL